MKKVLLSMLHCVAMLFLFSCEKEYIPQEVELSLDYAFVESGDMSRVSGEEVYINFYNKHIKSKILTPKTYELVFTNKETGAISLINGRWDRNDGIRLVEGQYNVVGHSAPLHKRDYYHELSDSVYIAFNETITIRRDDTKLTLNALYDSFLLLFDKDNTDKIYCKCTGFANVQPLVNDENNFWLFMQKTYMDNDKTDAFFLEVYRIDGIKSTIYLQDIPFNIGKYYYFNNVTNSFDIPPMDSGN